MKKLLTLLLTTTFLFSFLGLQAGSPMTPAALSPGETTMSTKELRQMEKRQRKMDRLERKLEKRQDEILDQLDEIENNHEDASTKAMAKNLRYAIIAGGAAIVASILGGIIAGSLFWIIASVLWIVAIVFLVLWLINDV